MPNYHTSNRALVWQLLHSKLTVTIVKTTPVIGNLNAASLQTSFWSFTLTDFTEYVDFLISYRFLCKTHSVPAVVTNVYNQQRSKAAGNLFRYCMNAFAHPEFFVKNHHSSVVISLQIGWPLRIVLRYASEVLATDIYVQHYQTHFDIQSDARILRKSSWYDRSNL